MVGIRPPHHLLPRCGYRASWKTSAAAKLLRDSPSQRDHPTQALADDYRHARGDAAIDIGLPLATLPEACPWTVEQVLDEDFWPEALS